MSYIHKFIEDIEIHEPVQWLFRRFVSEYNEQNSVAWNKHVKQNADEYHRKILLKQGRCDFDKPPYNLTSAELIVLYNYYYFPMHYQSSYEIYIKLFEEQEEFQNQTFFFHDFGCGSLSSTMAFGASFQKYNLSELTFQKYNLSELTFQEHNSIDVLNNFQFYFQGNAYEGVSSLELGCIRNAGSITNFKLPNLINGFWLEDISNSIITFLKGFLQENFYIESYQHHFFNTASCTDSHFYFGNVADKFYLGSFDYEPIQPFKSFCNAQNKTSTEITVILNFSYVLASESVEIETINSMISEYLNTGCRLIIVNQNPDLDSLNKNWEILKDKVKYVKSIKGLQPIKHFGSKSKSRYEVLFLSAVNTINENGVYNILSINIEDVKKYLIDKKWQKINEILEIIQNQNYSSYNCNFEKYTYHFDLIYATILNSADYIEYLLEYMDNETDIDFIYFLLASEVCSYYYKNLHLLFIEKLFQNKSKLSHNCYEHLETYCYMAINDNIENNIDKISKKRIELVYNYGVYQYFRLNMQITLLLHLNKNEDAKFLIKTKLRGYMEIESIFEVTDKRWDDYIREEYGYLLNDDLPY